MIYYGQQKYGAWHPAYGHSATSNNVLTIRYNILTQFAMQHQLAGYFALWCRGRNIELFLYLTKVAPLELIMLFLDSCKCWWSWLDIGVPLWVGHFGFNSLLDNTIIFLWGSFLIWHLFSFYFYKISSSSKDENCPIDFSEQIFFPYQPWWFFPIRSHAMLTWIHAYSY